MNQTLLINKYHKKQKNKIINKIYKIKKKKINFSTSYFSTFFTK